MKKILFVFILILTLIVPITANAEPKIYNNTVFDAEYYRSNNPDVVAVLGDTEEILLQHYINHGAAEGRLPFSPTANIYSKTVQPSAEVLARLTDLSLSTEGVDYTLHHWNDSPESPVYAYFRLALFPKASTSLTLVTRTDFPDGLIDLDGNGIDDRDPINTLDVIDLNTNGIDDRNMDYYNQETNTFVLDGSAPDNAIAYVYLCEHGVAIHPYEAYGPINLCEVCTSIAIAKAEEQKRIESKKITCLDLGYKEGDTEILTNSQGKSITIRYTGQGITWVDVATGKKLTANIKNNKIVSYTMWLVG